MTDLTTLANVKQWAGVTSTTDDTMLSRLITQASNMIEAYLSRSLGVNTYTEIYDGHGNDTQFLNEWPVTSVASVYVGSSLISPGTVGATQSLGWLLTSDSRGGQQAIRLLGYSFTRGLSNVVINYTAGYTTIPDDIEQACIEIVGERYSYKNRIGQSSKSLGGQETMAYSLKDMPDYVRSILNPHRRVIPSC